MSDSQTTLLMLIDEADRAYQDARIKVWDQMSPGERLDVSRLSPSQQASLRNLSNAEAALAQHREMAYVTSPSAYQSLSLL